MKPKTMTLTRTHPLWKTYIKFHTGQFKGVERQEAKNLLFGIHYGWTDTCLADIVVKRIREKIIRAH